MGRQAKTGRGWLYRFLFNSEPLPHESWAARHRFIRGLAILHVPLLMAFAVGRRAPLYHTGLEMAGLTLVIAIASVDRFDRRIKEAFGTIGVMLTSALTVHISGGSIEAHFHFFVMLAVVSLYQSWFAFVLGIGFVVVHHGLLGTIHPSEVYNHPAAIRSPWLWAAIHAFFVSLGAVVYVIQWRLNELARNDARELYRQLYEGQRSVVKQLEEAATMKDELVSTVSHELRTPLTSIIGYVEMLQSIDDLSDDDREQYIGYVSRQAARLNFLIENLLNYRGASFEESTSTVVRGLVQEVVKHQSTYPGGEHLRFTTNVDPDAVVAVGSRALRLVLANLVNNAVKYATPGTDVLIAATRTTLGERRVVRIVVSNECPPIRDDDLDRIFGAFVQLDATTTRSVPGVGLGLHIVGRTVATYDGTVEVAYVGGRVNFTVHLPAASARNERTLRDAIHATTAR